MTALSACAALIARERDGGLGQRIEIPLSDALLEGSGILTTRVEKQAPCGAASSRPGSTGRATTRCMCFTSGAFRHLAGLARVSGNEAWLEDGSLDWAALRTDPEAPAAWRAKLVSLFATRDADEWEALLRPAGIPIAQLRTTREWLREPAAEAAGCVTEQDDGAGHPVRTLRQAVDFEPLSCPASARARPGFAGLPGTPPLRGMKVLDLCRVVAAPTVTRLLTDLGAEVIKVDIDPAEARSAYDEPLFHVYLNRGKKGLILNLKTPADRKRFDALVADADMLVTNVSAGRLPEDGAVARRAAPAQPGARLHLPEPLRRHRAVGRLQGLRRDRQLRHRRLVAHGGLGDRPVGRAPGQRPALALHRLHGRRAQRLRGRRRPLRPRPARPHLPGEHQPGPDRPA